MNYAIINSTIRTLLRQKVLYNVLFLAIALLFVGLMASQLAYGRQDRILIHVGTASMTFCMVFVAAFAGARLIQDDIESRIAYLILSRPISRLNYLFARTLGLILFLAMNIALIHVVLAAGLAYLDSKLSIAFIQNGILIWIHMSWIAILAVAFSFFMSTALNVMSMIGIFFLTQNLHLLIDMLSKTGATITAKALSFLPQGQYFLMDTRVAYRLDLTTAEMLQRSGYGAIWMILFFIFAARGLNKKSI